MSAGVAGAALIALAERHGVASAYVDGRGSEQQVSAATLMQVLVALGVPIERERDAEVLTGSPEGIAAGSAVVIVAGRQVRIDSGRTSSRAVKCRVTISLDDAGAADRVIDTTCSRDGLVELDLDLPVGVHRATIQLRRGEPVERHLVVTTGRCVPGPQPPRTWGIFSPISALRSAPGTDHGGGDLTALNELASAVTGLGGSVVATLPLVATSPGEASPYSPLTRRFWDERWVDPAWVARRLGVEAPAARAQLPVHRYEPDLVLGATRGSLAEVWAAAAAAGRLDPVEHWRRANPQVEQWARWKAVAAETGWDHRVWSSEQHDSVRRGSVGVTDAVTGAVDFEVFAQWAVTAQLTELGGELRTAGSTLYLDLPVGTSSASYDVWDAPHRFVSGISVGAPPDAFFPGGQTWGLPPLNPAVQSAEGHRYLVECLRAHLQVCSMLRIDHVMGLHRLFWVPEESESGEGTYVRYPAYEQWSVVAALSEQYGAAIVGEDLGTVPEETRRAMADSGARGLFIGQDETRHPFRLSRPVPTATVASLNTHDLPPVAAWHDSPDGPGPLAAAVVVRDHLLGELAASSADVVLISDQDLTLDERRFNVPGEVGGDIWRLRSLMTMADLRDGTGPGAEARRVATNVDRWRRTWRGEWPSGVTPLLDGSDVATLHDGTHACLADRFGLHPTVAAGVAGCSAVVWAPHAVAVAVGGDFDGWAGALLHRRADTGIWDGFIPSAMLGDRYKLQIQGGDGVWRQKSDPFARACELPPDNASIITADDPAEGAWTDGEWMASRPGRHQPGQPLSIYELHLGSWRRHPDGSVPTYREVAPWLIEYVQQMGFTHVELMAVMEHPFGGSWGYHVTGYFAPTNRYGTPADFAWMIDQLHGAGIGVLLDWVPAHFPNDEHGLADFDGEALFEYANPLEGRHPQWGSRVFDWGRPEIRAFLVSSARWWIEKFHIDGIRVDAVASMLYRDFARESGDWIPNRLGGRENLEAVDFVRQLTSEIHRSTPGALVIAEESTAWPGVTAPTGEGGLGFDLKWDLGWMHDMLDYLARDPVHRPWHQDQLTFRPMYQRSERFVLPLSHDEVVHGKASLVLKMAGDDWQRRANLRLLFGHQFAMPGIPLIFMGCELAMNEEWDHDTELPWWLLEHLPHRGMAAWVAELNRLLRAVPALASDGRHDGGFEWSDCDDRASSVVVWIRRPDAAGEGAGEAVGDVVVAANFTPTPHERYRVGVPTPGNWFLWANSDEERFGGSGFPTPTLYESEPVPIKGWQHSILVTLPPLALTILARSTPT